MTPSTLRRPPFYLMALLTCCLHCSQGADQGKPPGPLPADLPIDTTSIPPGGCSKMHAGPVRSVDGYLADQYAWSDRNCNVRRADLIRNDAPDPSGNFGGYMRRYTYLLGSKLRQCIGASSHQPGFGLVVNHVEDGSPASGSIRQPGGAYRTLFLGRHHAIHEYTFRYAFTDKTEPVRVTVRYMFATGRDHPVWAVTFDSSAAPPNTINADTRSPYGDLNWDGDGSAEVDGVGWGDHFKFTSTSSPVTLLSGWDYTKPNTVPYVKAWSQKVDAQMGIVQTQTYAQHDAGGAQFYTKWGTVSTTGPMPAPTDWTYQLNQYELNDDMRSKRVAWGTNYGAVGNTQYLAYGDSNTLSGYPYQSYSTFIVLGPHSADPVAAQVAQVETVQQTRLVDLGGCVVASEGPAGVGQPGMQQYSPPGYDPIFSTWVVQRTVAVPINFSFNPNGGALSRPVVEIRKWGTQAAKEVLFNGTALVADRDYYASVDSNGQVLWLTLARDLSANAAIVVR